MREHDIHKEADGHATADIIFIDDDVTYSLRSYGVPEEGVCYSLLDLAKGVLEKLKNRDTLLSDEAIKEFKEDSSELLVQMLKMLEEI